MDSILAYQPEILNFQGYQKWTRIVLRDFGEGHCEISANRDYETWSEPDDTDAGLKTARGAGDREKSVERSSRRAKTKVRHLCKALRARYMVTLTTRRVITDLEEFQRLFQEFVRRIRSVADFRYVAVPEFQQRGALHLHIAVPTRQDYKLLWSIWHRVVGKDEGRVHVTKGIKRNDIHKVASYLAKYITKAFEDGALNKRRYWASKRIDIPAKVVHLLRSDWSLAEVIRFVCALLDERRASWSFDSAWLREDGKLFWITT